MFGVLAPRSGKPDRINFARALPAPPAGALHLVHQSIIHHANPQIHSAPIALFATASAPLHVPSTTTARGRDNCKSLELVRCGCRSWLLFRPLRNCLPPQKKNSTKATHETTNKQSLSQNLQPRLFILRPPSLPRPWLPRHWTQLTSELHTRLRTQAALPAQQHLEPHAVIPNQQHPLIDFSRLPIQRALHCFYLRLLGLIYLLPSSRYPKFCCQTSAVL